VMALVAGAFTAIRHAGAEGSRRRAAHIAELILDGLRPAAEFSGRTGGRPRPAAARRAAVQPSPGSSRW
jgi:hypothetical protein